MPYQVENEGGEVVFVSAFLNFVDLFARGYACALFKCKDSELKSVRVGTKDFGYTYGESTQVIAVKRKIGA